jgi:hypothetical protein
MCVSDISNSPHFIFFFVEELVGGCGEKLLDLRRTFGSCSINLSEGDDKKEQKWVTITVSHGEASVVQNAVNEVKKILCHSLDPFKAARLFYELALFQRHGRNTFYRLGDILKETDKFTRKMQGDVFMTHVRVPPRVRPVSILGKGGAFRNTVMKATYASMTMVSDEQSRSLYVILIGGNETNVKKARDMVDRRMSEFT